MIKQWIKNLIAKNKVYTPSMKEVVAEFKEIEQIPKECYLYDCREDTCHNEYDCKVKCPRVTSKFKA